MSKRKKTEKKKQEEISPIRDLVGFALLAVAVFSFLSVLSYHPTDPSWNTASIGPAVRVQNYCGIVGSYLADALVQLVGYASYLLPAAMIGIAWAVIFRPSFFGTFQPILGFSLLALSVTFFLGLASGEAEPAWGGIVGILLQNTLERYVGFFGALLFGVTMFTLGLVLTTRLTLRNFFESFSSIRAFIGRLAHGFWEQVRAFMAHLRQSMAREGKKLEKGFDEVRKLDKVKIAGSNVPMPTEEKKPSKFKAAKPEEDGETKEIPIVVPKSKPAFQMPSFHSLEDERETKPASAKKTLRSYKLPDISLLESRSVEDIKIDRNELFKNAQTLEKKLKDFGVFGKVVEVQPGPVVTMYEFEPAPGVKVNQITRLNDDLALALKAMSVRITPLPGKAVIGIEVANRDRQIVYLREVLGNEIFTRNTSRLCLAIGKDISGIPYVNDLRKMPHLMVAGATGSGKSVAINSMILSILYKATPDEVRMILVDPKMLELSLYDEIPHLLLPVVTDPRKAAAALRWAVSEMERRYRLMADLGVRNIEGYNKKVLEILENGTKKEEKDSAELPLENR